MLTIMIKFCFELATVEVLQEPIAYHTFQNTYWIEGFESSQMGRRIDRGCFAIVRCRNRDIYRYRWCRESGCFANSLLILYLGISPTDHTF
jgi:hypothetical protein